MKQTPSHDLRVEDVPPDDAPVAAVREFARTIPEEVRRAHAWDALTLLDADLHAGRGLGRRSLDELRMGVYELYCGGWLDHYRAARVADRYLQTEVESIDYLGHPDRRRLTPILLGEIRERVRRR